MCDWNHLPLHFRPSVSSFSVVAKALSFTDELSLFLSFLLFISSHAEDGRQMYFGGSVVGKASTLV